MSLEPDADELDRLTAACVAFVRAHVASLADQPASDLDGADELRATFREPAPEQGRAIEEILARLAPAIGKSFNTAGPGYMGFIPGGGIMAAALADYLACATNRYVGVARPAPVLAEIEATAVRWLADLMGYPPSARGVFTSGGSISNLVAIITARTARLGEDFHDGTVYFSDQTHLSVDKAVRLAGFRARNVRRLPVDARLRLRPDALERALADDRARGLRPCLLVANVGTTNTGAVDPIPALLDIARAHGLWVHADAAYGGFFRITRGGEQLMPGIERCDSITLDPHKGMFLPYGTGCLLVRDGEALHRAHATDADYLRDAAPPGGMTNFMDLSPEQSRDFRGLRVWLPVQLHGVAAWRAALEEKLELTRWAHAELARDGRFEMLDEPQLSVVAFRLRAPVSEEMARNSELLERVNARRRVFLSSTIIDARPVLRICVLSFRTHRDRVEDAVRALREETA